MTRFTGKDLMVTVLPERGFAADCDKACTNPGSERVRPFRAADLEALRRDLRLRLR